MEKFNFDAKKQEAAIKSIEDLCYYCDEHKDECPLAVAIGELKQEYNPKNRPNINYKDFEFDKGRVRNAISVVENMCLKCEEHTDKCPIPRAVSVIERYAK